MQLVAVGHVASADGVAQDAQHRVLLPTIPAPHVAVPGLVPLRFSLAPIQDAGDRDGGLVGQIEFEDLLDKGGLNRIDDQLLLLHGVTQGDRTPRPFALPARRGHLVPGPFRYHISLERREAHEQMKRQLPYRIGGGKILRDADELDAGAVEPIHHRGEVKQRARQAVHLVNDHDVDPTGVDVGQQALERRPVYVGPGEPAVVIALIKSLPPVGRLGADVRFARLSLSIEGVEFLLKAHGRGLAGIDGAARFLLGRPVLPVAVPVAPAHGVLPVPASFWPVSPKNRNPFQWVPVMARATCDRLGYRLPS